MRLCLVATSYSRFDDDGNARFVRSIAEAQAVLGHEVHVLAPYSPQVKPYASPVQVHWFKYVWPSQRGVMGHAAALENDRRLRGAALWQAPLFAASLSLHFQRLFSRYKFDLVHAHWVVPNGVLAWPLARLNRLPFFISLHGSDVYLATRQKWFGKAAGGALYSARGVTACSQPLAEAAIELGAQRDRVHLLPWGADPDRFDPEADRVELRHRLNLKSDALIILAAGRLVGKKGFRQLVQAMPLVCERLPQIQLIILGEGPERGWLEGYIAEASLSDCVQLRGAVAWSAMPDYLVSCDVFCMPSVRDVYGNLDGLPTVILEAMAAGRPVIATRVAGVPLVVRDPETGVLVDNATPDELSAALVRVLGSPIEREAMGRAARRQVETELNWLEVARNFDRMYAAGAPELKRKMTNL